MRYETYKSENQLTKGVVPHMYTWESVRAVGGTAVRDLQMCTRMNGRMAVLRGAILGRQYSLQCKSQNVVLFGSRGEGVMPHLQLRGEESVRES
jgi:hypothetical protein